MAILVSAILFLSCTVILMPGAAAAHGPSKVVLAYDKAAKTLNVPITHTVSDAKSHYIKTVDVTVNGKTVQSMTYTSQPAPDTFTYTYPVDAVPGAEISARAECNYFGSDTDSITVP